MYHVPSRIVMRLMHQHTMQEELETRTKRKNCERDTYNHSKRQKIRRCSSEVCAGAGGFSEHVRWRKK